MKRIKLGLITIVALLMYSWSFAQNCNDAKLDTTNVTVNEMKFEGETNLKNQETSLETHNSSSEALESPNDTLKEKDDVNNLINIIAAIFIAIGTLLTAIIAFFALRVSRNSIDLAKQTFYMQEEHNLKSVKPIGDIVTGNYADDIYVKIVNNGIGPLIITKFRVIDYNANGKNYENLIDTIPNSILNKIVFWRDGIRGTENRALKAGDELFLLRLTTKQRKQSKEGVIELKEYLKKVALEWTYEDIYENPTIKNEKRISFWGEESSYNEDSIVKVKKMKG